MKSFIICTDSAADLDKDYVKANDIRVVPFYVSFNDSDYLREGIDISQEEFFDKLKGDKTLVPKTSCPSISDYLTAFEDCLKEAEAVICICISSKLSGSYQSAYNATLELNTEDKQRVYVVDSLLATAAQGLLINEAVIMQKRKLSPQTCVEKLNEIKYTGRIDFVVDDLTYLQRGGRIGKAASLAGTILNVKPILSLRDGELYPVAKVRGRKKAAAEIKRLFKEEVKDQEEAYAFTALNFPQMGDNDGFFTLVEKPDIPFAAIGATIGAHAGITAAGIAYIKRYTP